MSGTSGERRSSREMQDGLIFSAAAAVHHLLS